MSHLISAAVSILRVVVVAALTVFYTYAVISLLCWLNGEGLWPRLVVEVAGAALLFVGLGPLCHLWGHLFDRLVFLLTEIRFKRR